MTGRQCGTVAPVAHSHLDTNPCTGGEHPTERCHPKSAGQSKSTPVWKERAQLLTVCQTPCVVAQARKPGLSRL